MPRPAQGRGRQQGVRPAPPRVSLYSNHSLTFERAATNPQENDDPNSMPLWAQLAPQQDHEGERSAKKRIKKAKKVNRPVASPRGVPVVLPPVKTSRGTPRGRTGRAAVKESPRAGKQQKRGDGGNALLLRAIGAERAHLARAGTGAWNGGNGPAATSGHAPVPAAQSDMSPRCEVSPPLEKVQERFSAFAQRAQATQARGPSSLGSNVISAADAAVAAGCLAARNAELLRGVLALDQKRAVDKLADALGANVAISRGDSSEDDDDED